MKITVESTTKIVQLEGHVGGVPARVWEGTTERGVRVVALVTRITPLDGDSAQFEQELQECR
ncbi:MAG TPA: hypothetical protein VKQ71_08515, partial [Acidimicrobiales bacterium]|nr:hypothetical protein [Acidimicrobiales bacterium]